MQKVIQDLFSRLSWNDALVTSLIVIIGWLALRLKDCAELRLKSEELRLKSDEARAKSESGRLEAEQHVIAAGQQVLAAEKLALELRNEMPTIVAEHIERTEAYLSGKIEALRSRVDAAIARVHDLEGEIAKIRERGTVSDDELRRLDDDIKSAEEEISDVSRFVDVVESKRAAIAHVREVVSSQEFTPEFIEAGEQWLNKQLRHSAALRTTARVVERTNAEVVSSQRTAIAAYKAKVQALEAAERRLKAARERALRLPLEDESPKPEPPFAHRGDA